MIFGNAVGGGAAQTYLLKDEAGNQVYAVAVKTRTEFDATANDIRIGKKAVAESGVVTGEKVIPAYHSTEGYRVIPNGSAFSIPYLKERYDFTKLMVIICPFSGSVNGSVAAERVVIGESVYAVNSTVPISVVVRNGETETIDLGVVNESGNLYLLRYFTYKEIY
jgi:hypothetical protein